MVVLHIRVHQVDQVVPLQVHHLGDPLQAQAVIITTGLPHLVQSLLRQISKVSKLRFKYFFRKLSLLSIFTFTNVLNIHNTCLGAIVAPISLMSLLTKSAQNL